MIQTFLILNDREAREARNAIAEISHALTSEEQFKKLASGLPLSVLSGYKRTLTTQKENLEAILGSYERAKAGDYADFIKNAGSDVGAVLIIARIVKNFSQKDLARRVGLKEQQIQRYESDRYRSITLAGLRRIAQALGVQLRAGLDPWLTPQQGLVTDYKPDEIKKVIRHAKEMKWFDNASTSPSDMDDSAQQENLQRFISDHLINYGSPALLRTGLNVEDLSDDFLLVVWKARVAKLAEAAISTHNLVYKEMDISWLPELAKLSLNPDGPVRAKELLLQKGIVLIIEPQIAGLKLDGAAFIVDGIPVIGMSLRRDTIDNFWYTLHHEVAHVILHYRMGLALGFYDDGDKQSLDGIEKEADDFASNLLIPDEIWRRSTARISKTAPPIEKFAKEIGIHPAIVFGRIQRERNNYSVFADKIGRGLVRKQFIKQGETINA